MRKQTLIIVALSLTLAIMPSAAFSQAGDNNSPMVGLWQVPASPTVDCATGQPDGLPTVPVNYLFNQGGTMTEEEANSIDGPYRASAQGIWKQVSGRNYLAVFTNFAFNPDGTLGVILKFRTNIVLAKDGNSFTERGTADVTLPDGTTVATVCFADTATRFNF